MHASLVSCLKRSAAALRRAARTVAHRCGRRAAAIAAAASALVLYPGAVAMDEATVLGAGAYRDVLTLDEAAVFLRLDARTLAVVAERGEVPGRQIGSGWRFSRQALLAWLDASERPLAAALPPPASEMRFGARDLAVWDPGPWFPPIAGGGAARSDGERPDYRDRDPAGRGHAERAGGATPRPAGRWEPAPTVASGATGDDLPRRMPVVADAGGQPMSEAQMASVIGRGSAGVGGVRQVAQAPGAAAAADAAPDGQDGIGERPSTPTAEDIALRGERVILRQGEATLELGLFYSDAASAIGNALGNTAVGVPHDADAFTIAYGGRYGIRDDLQLVLANAYTWARADVALSSTEFTRTRTNRWNDVRVAMRYAALKQDDWQPDVILSLESRIPGEDSAWGLGGRMTLSKSIDPVVLFTDFGYLHRFDSGSVNRPFARDIIDFSVGYAFAINDRLSTKAQASGVFLLGTRDSQRFPTLESELFTLQLGVTTLLTRDLFIEPTVTFALSGPPTVTFGISLPYTFRPF